MTTLTSQLEQARALLAAQRLPEARVLYQELCRHTPGDPDLWYEFGNLLLGMGESAAAAQCYQNAVGLRPTFAEAFNNLGISQTKQGQYDAAVASYRRALALKPHYRMAHNNLGNTLVTLGKLDEAAEAFQRTIELHPEHAAAHYNLANLRVTQQRHAEAEAGYRAALARSADYPAAANNLGNLLITLDRLDETVELLRQLLMRHPDYPSAHYNLGRALLRQEKYEEAMKEFQTAVRLRPDYAEARNNIGTILHTLGRYDEAIGQYREALRIDPAHAGAHNNLGVALYDQGQLGQAAEYHRESLRLDPGQVEVRLNLGEALQAQGWLDESLALYRETLELNPDHVEAHSNLLFALNYLPRLTPDALYREHRRWAEHHVRHAPAVVAHANRRDPERQLRVGYVSPDLRGHSVAYFTAPILAHHDRDRIETFCYAQVARGDAMTDYLRSLAGHWRRTVGLSDAELAAQVRADGIDILVDLSGHTGHNRLPVFATKPAPVQLTYLGYPNTTGLPAIHYRLTDAWADPPGQEQFHCEQLIRLPRGFLCYAPPPDAPEVSALPSLTAGHVTFGSFNNLAKINTEVVALWARLMHDLPQARLLIKNGSLRDAGTRERYHELFTRHGVARERVTLAAWTPGVHDHLAVYAGIDIALDTFPYNGTTTTCEALWMGVPVIALAGDRHAARVGVSLLSRIGLTELIAGSPGDYISIARRLSQDPQRLSDLRHGLRARLQASTLCDAAAFTRDLEDAYRDMWRRWCEKS